MKLILVFVFVAAAAVYADPGVGDFLGGVVQTLDSTIDTVARTGKSLLGIETQKPLVCSIAGSPYLASYYRTIGVAPIIGTQFCSCPAGIYGLQGLGIPGVTA